jgi:alkyl hydroperoxide reductase subunit AhpC
LIALAKRYKVDVREAAAEIVLINSNDMRQVPEDSFDAMRVLAKSKAYPFAYLYDETQAVAKAFGATRTPQVFVVDGGGVVRYAGAIDDSVDAGKVTRRYLQDALDAVVAGRSPATARTEPVGCTIKWKKDARL